MSGDDDSDNEDLFKVAEKTHKRIADGLLKDGYRDGITDGQEVSLQKGFNSGYTLGYTSVHKLAKLRGILWSLAAVNKNSSEISEELHKKLRNSEDQLKEAAEELYSDAAKSSPNQGLPINELESQILNALKEPFLNECKRLNLIDENSAIQLFDSTIK